MNNKIDKLIEQAIYNKYIDILEDAVLTKKLSSILSKQFSKTSKKKDFIKEYLELEKCIQYPGQEIALVEVLLSNYLKLTIEESLLSMKSNLEQKKEEKKISSN
ncbi:hypothetical protein HOK00_09290 [bacterium]|jgi:hypothetical protein|nr:hypothetical protein [bacterium]